MAELQQNIESRNALFAELWAKQQEEYAAKSAPIKVTMPDGNERDANSWVSTPMDIAKAISLSLAKGVIVAKVDGNLWDLGRVLEDNCKLELLKFDDPEARSVFAHSSAHALGGGMEAAKGMILNIGPPLENGGFFYEGDCGELTVSEADHAVIEEKVKAITSGDHKYDRLMVTKENALKLFGYNKYKEYILRTKVPEDSKCAVYRCGPMVDPCRGPHIYSTGKIAAFCVTKNSSAYYQGKADQEVLQRVYGMAFPDSKQMTVWKKQVEEARKRDHRVVGVQKELFFMHEFAPGMTFWQPKGTAIYNRLQTFIRREYRKRGYDEVQTPNLFMSKLWKTSGHWEHYKEDMFTLKCCGALPPVPEEEGGKKKKEKKPKKQKEGEAAPEEAPAAPKEVDPEDEIHALKPMNCPGHMLVFKSRPRSYRELPIRMAEFGVLHRNEATGALSGLTRVRKFVQDDAHIFSRPCDIEQEVAGVLDFMNRVYGVLGLKFVLVLSTRNPKKWLGDLALWDRAEADLASALNNYCQVRAEFPDPLEEGKVIPYDGTDPCIKKYKLAVKQEKVPEPRQYWSLNPADAAFYGPKIDVQIEDCLERLHQCATCQLDFVLPERFGLSYVMSKEEQEDVPAVKEGEEPKKAGLDGTYQRPVVIHRAILGSFERNIAVLTEHYGGKWPFWLSPTQIAIIPCHKDHNDYATQVRDELYDNDFEAWADIGGDKLNKKIRKAEQAGFNFVLVVGKDEADNNTVNVRVSGKDGSEGKVLGDDVMGAQPVPRQNFLNWISGLRSQYSRAY